MLADFLRPPGFAAGARALFVLLAASLVFAPQGRAEADDIITKGPFTFETTKLEVNSFTGRLKIVIRDAPGMELTLKGKAEELDEVEFEARGDTLVIEHNGRSWSLFRSYNRKPNLTLLVPEGTPINIARMTGRLRVGDTKAPFSLRMKSGDANIGTVSTAEIEVVGSGDVKLVAVDGPFDGAVTGSGDLSAGPVGPSTIRLRGSGSVSIEKVSGSLDAESAGSGEIAIGLVEGDTRLEMAGSGDCVINEIRGKLLLEMAGSGDCNINGGRAQDMTIAAAGSGDIEFGGEAVGEIEISRAGSGNINVQSVNGELTAELAGSGDVTIEEGRTSPLKVTITGSGDFTFDGKAENAEFSIRGSGDIRIGEVSGSIKQQTRGSGSIEIGS